jgi:glycosyltransferase involved in cell wall biosynthesis
MRPKLLSKKIQMDCFISPSREEAFGYAVAEAAYCDCQVVASNVPGQNTMIDIPGIIWIETENIKDLETAICTAMLNKENGQLKDIKLRQRAYTQEHYDIPQWVEMNKSLYKKYFARSVES